MVAALGVSNDLARIRRDIRKLVLPGQRRIHFTKEHPDRKRLILSRLTATGVTAQIFHCTTKDPVRGRNICLAEIVAYAAEGSFTKLVIERDESIEKSDRQTLFREVRRHGLTDELNYVLETPYQEPLLWVADAIAWSYTKGGEWRQRVDPLIAGITILSP